MYNGTQTTIVKVLCNDLLGKLGFPAVQKDIARLGGSSFLTEFCSNPIADEDDVKQSNNDLGLADTYHQSWMQWGYSEGDFYYNNALNMNYTKVFSRTYARAISGVPSKTHFDTETKVFTLCYFSDSKIKQPTEIFIPYIYQYSPDFVGIYVEGEGASVEKITYKAGKNFYVNILHTIDEQICVLVKKFNSCAENGSKQIYCIKP